ncbi:MAG: hypothetical protein AB7E12_15325 [Burkholderiaceae bacterium]
MTLIVGTVEHAVSAGRRRYFDEGPFRGVADYLFETMPGEDLGPQALIARQTSGCVLPVHFHRQHQFQIVLRGSGTLGKHRLAPGSVHYTSPQSAYGPIVAGEQGLDYFTFRVLTDKGAWYMPEARKFMQLGMFKEQAMGTLPKKLTQHAWQTLIPRREDGLGAWSCDGQAGSLYTIDEPGSSAGRFYAILRGSYSLDDQILPLGSCVFQPGSDRDPELLCCEDGSWLVVVQFPDQAVLNVVPPEFRIAPSPRGTAAVNGLRARAS